MQSDFIFWCDVMYQNTCMACRMSLSEMLILSVQYLKTFWCLLPYFSHCFTQFTIIALYKPVTSIFTSIPTDQQQFLARTRVINW